MMKNPFDLTGKIALVTGASSGLGVQFAEALGEQGAKLAIAARRLDRLEALAEDFKSKGVECLPIQADLSHEEDIINMVESVVSHYGRIDILVNNAGVARGETILDTTKEIWDSVIEVNQTGHFLASREAGKHMIKQGYGKHQ